MKKRFLADALRVALDDLCTPTERLLLAVSGGSDSLGMLHLICKIRSSALLRVAFVDHGLRPNVDREWKLVSDECRRLDVVAERLRVDDCYETSSCGEGIQQWARVRRYQLLTQSAKRFGCNIIVTGHTLDDQAETVLLRLLRGTGLDGLGAVAPVREISPDTKVIRPMLGMRRTELQQWLTDNQIDWVRDPSNENARFARVQARQLLPEMSKCNPRIQEHLSALSQEARALTQWLNETLLSDGDMERLRHRNGFRVSRSVFERVPVALHGRIVRQALYEVTGHLLRFERQHVEEVVTGLHATGRSRKFILPGNVQLWASDGDLYLFAAQNASHEDFSEQKLTQCSSNLWKGEHPQMKIALKIRCDSADIADWCEGRLSNWRIRPWAKGDGIYGSSRKVGRLLVNHRVPIFYRNAVPVLVTSENEAVSIPGLLKSRVSGLRMEWDLHNDSSLRDLRQFALSLP